MMLGARDTIALRTASDRIRAMPLLDRTDRAILAALQRDGRLPNNVLADRVGLSPAPCLRRVRRLETEGYIAGYAALLSPDKLDRGLVVYVRIRLSHQTRDAIERFEREIVGVPDVLECHAMVGDPDYMLRVAARDLDQYREWFMEHLAPLAGVDTIASQVAFRTIKSTTELPLD
jgi:Lrp/AsnC family transcriptional regulator, leucine-responsive regulatory protein